MKKKNRFWISPLIIIMGLLFLAGFCQKDDDDDTPGEITDKDGNVYTSVIIGTQEWMAENLKTTKYNDGTDIPLVTDAHEWSDLTTNAYCWYNNDAATYKTPYGALYNWYAVNTGKLCPTGWHIPTDEEWKQLEMYLGMSQADANNTGWRGTDEGGKLKEAGNSHWDSPNTGATNESGFSALPGGYRETSGSFLYTDLAGDYWSASQYLSGSAWSRLLHYNFSNIRRDGLDKHFGFSIRCVRN